MKKHQSGINKNFSFSIDAQGMQSAQLYDLLSGRVCGYQDMAQPIGGETNFAVIDADCWARFAKDCDVPTTLIARLRNQLLKQLAKHIAAVCDDCQRNMSSAGQKQVNAITQSIAETATRF